VSTAPLEFWFEFASTYSYPAAMRVEAAARAAGVPLAWRPFLVGPIFRAQGWNDSPFNIYPAKGRYMWRDLERICAQLGLPLRRPSAFPRNGLLAAARERIEAALASESKERLRAQSERVVALGIIGAPTFTVGAELFRGNDRLETALPWWQRERDDLARAAAP
jgi:2-hydroxychromene-2-carboxylate isomerase